MSTGLYEATRESAIEDWKRYAHQELQDRRSIPRIHRKMVRSGLPGDRAIEILGEVGRRTARVYRFVAVLHALAGTLCISGTLLIWHLDHLEELPAVLLGLLVATAGLTLLLRAWRLRRSARAFVEPDRHIG